MAVFVGVNNIARRSRNIYGGSGIQTWTLTIPSGKTISLYSTSTGLKYSDLNGPQSLIINEITSTSSLPTTPTDVVWYRGKATYAGTQYLLNRTWIEQNPEIIESNFQTGTEGVARKIKKGYVGVNGVAKLFWSGLTEFIYTGTMTETIVIVEEKEYKLLTLTTSGTLLLSGNNPKVTIWMCGGGGGGAQTWVGGGGGGGGYVATSSDLILTGTYPITIGTGGVGGTGGYTTLSAGTNGGTTNGFGLSALGGYGALAPSSYPNGGAGGSGGGGGGGGTTGIGGLIFQNGVGGAGSGISTVPFGLTDIFSPHCGGGGGGGYYRIFESGYKNSYGGNGGSDGAKGNIGRDSGSGDNYVLDPGGGGGTGGILGGGKGGSYSSSVVINAGITAGSNASFYGGGGGGGGGFGREILGYSAAGGNGYQGIVYILVKE